MSSRLGLLACAKKPVSVISMPVKHMPHCTASYSSIARCNGDKTPSRAKDSTVVTCHPTASPTGTRHDMAGCPSSKTLQAPQKPSRHTTFAPVRKNSSRRTSTSGVNGSLSENRSSPLILSGKGMAQYLFPGVQKPAGSLPGRGGEYLVASGELARKRLVNGFCDLDGVRRVAVYADRLGDDRYVLAADRTRQSFVHRPLHFRRDFGGGDCAVLLGDDLAAIIVIVEVRVKFAREGDSAPGEHLRHRAVGVGDHRQPRREGGVGHAFRD